MSGQSRGWRNTSVVFMRREWQIRSAYSCDLRGVTSEDGGGVTLGCENGGALGLDIGEG